MSQPSDTTPPGDTPVSEDSRQVHLDDAQKYFGVADKSAPDKSPLSKPDATPAPEAPKPVDRISSVVKLPGAKVPEAAPAADAPIEDIAKDLTAPDEKSKSFAGWKELKTRAQTAAEKAAKLEREVAELRKQTDPAKTLAPVDEATRARLAQLEQENAQFSSRLKTLDLKNHPEFISKFVTPQEKAKAELAAITKGDEVEVNLDNLLALSGKKFNSAVSEVLESLTPYARVQFQSKLDTLIAARIGADEALSKSDESLKSFSQNSGARSRATFDAVGKNFNGAFIPVAVDDKADDATKQAAAQYNAELASITTTAEKYAFGQLNEATAAEMAHKAALFDFTLSRGIPRIGELYNAELAASASRIAELEAQVKNLTVASPSLSGGSGAPGKDAPSGEETHLESARRYFGR